MDRIEENINKLLSGQTIEEPNQYCDFTIADQNEATVARGVTPSVPSDFVPKLHKTICYVVAAIIINEKNEVLMIQEAKSSCAGQWYLPAGCLEPNEDIDDAVVREVKEETGLDMKPTSLLMVQSTADGWMRFVFTGKIVGGTLKTPADADDHSIQAKWISNIDELDLRKDDIYPIVDQCRNYLHNFNKAGGAVAAEARELEGADETSIQWHPSLLPVKKSHQKLYLRVVICVRKRSNNRVHILLSEKNEIHLPMCELNPVHSTHNTFKKYMMEIFGADLPQHRPHGLICLEHKAKLTGNENPKAKAENDGLCLTLLVSIRDPLEDVGLIDKYTWLEVSEPLGQRILNRLARNMTVYLGPPKRT
ncbi:8-oxo-dGDP phosphatase NUDT18 [Ischnura elegans]|uniref:8-oxo-dGDP phosphatase NUDT18 n=1 Tax=Ischnura elegans TaxID=197161 RepID=UPI001ED8A3BB|nr:8-oxo-dGDP phosphatase NUDT18 [Ischnura elegans]